MYINFDSDFEIVSHSVEFLWLYTQAHNQDYSRGVQLDLVGDYSSRGDTDNNLMSSNHLKLEV